MRGGRFWIYYEYRASRLLNVQIKGVRESLQGITRKEWPLNKSGKFVKQEGL